MGNVPIELLLLGALLTLYLVAATWKDKDASPRSRPKGTLGRSEQCGIGDAKRPVTPQTPETKRH